jgi:hypothetical protein
MGRRKAEGILHPALCIPVSKKLDTYESSRGVWKECGMGLGPHPVGHVVTVHRVRVARMVCNLEIALPFQLSCGAKSSWAGAFD